MKPVVVVGSGLAGLVAAWAMAPQRCVLITPGRLTDGSASMLAQGGFAAAVAADDSLSRHADDTWRAGDRAGDQAAINRIIAGGPAALDELIRLGVPFDRTDGELDLALEAGHSRHRIAHSGDASGAAITDTIAATVGRCAHIKLIENTTVTGLLQSAGPGSRVTGVRTEEFDLDARAVILATGGYGGLFSRATSPAGALGSGIAMAARAGARTDDLHLVQFHPTGLAPSRPVATTPLLTEALRGAGAILLADGQRFVDELQPRDVVAAAVWERISRGQQVHLDARAVDAVTERFPQVTRLCRQFDLDPAVDLLPVQPAAHYSMGGVTVDGRGRSNLPGLWAVGETSRTGLHGANRLASNSLLEAFVTARAAAADVLAERPEEPWLTTLPATDPATVVPRPDPTSSPDLTSHPGPTTTGPAGTRPLRAPLHEIQHILTTGCGVLRDHTGISQVLTALAPDIAHDDRAYVAWLVARSALAHRHSRGAHRRVDTDAILTATTPDLHSEATA